jgi:heat shock protein HtpX
MYSDIAANKRKTVYIMAGFFVFVAAVAWLFGRMIGDTPYITYGAIIGSFIYAIFCYFSGGRMALAANGAQEIQKHDNPKLWRIVENLAITDGLPMPRVFIMQDQGANAFATGRDPQHSMVCVTTGLLEIMDEQELEGVLAHELGHIKNYDIRVSMIAFALTSVISLIADFIMHLVFYRDSDNTPAVFYIFGIAAAIIAPIIATMIQLAISRKREYLADATGALTTRYPEGLARALEKIGQAGSATSRSNTATAHLFFANPLRKGAIAGLFSTHPPIEERVRRLREMGSRA